MKRGIPHLCAGDNWEHNSSVAVATERTSGLDTRERKAIEESCIAWIYLFNSEMLIFKRQIHPFTSRFHLWWSFGFLVGVAQQSSSSSVKSLSSCLTTDTSTYTGWPSLVLNGGPWVGWKNLYWSSVEKYEEMVILEGLICSLWYFIDIRWIYKKKTWKLNNIMQIITFGKPHFNPQQPPTLQCWWRLLLLDLYVQTSFFSKSKAAIHSEATKQ